MNERFTVHGIEFEVNDPARPTYAEAKVGQIDISVTCPDAPDLWNGLAIIGNTGRPQPDEWATLVEFDEQRFESIEKAAEHLVGLVLDEFVHIGRLFPTLSVIRHKSAS